MTLKAKIYHPSLIWFDVMIWLFMKNINFTNTPLFASDSAARPMVSRSSIIFTEKGSVSIL